MVETEGRMGEEERVWGPGVGRLLGLVSNLNTTVEREWCI